MESLQTWLQTRRTDERSVVILLIQGYLALSTICFILLLLPICRRDSTTIIDQLFFSISIVSTTGLTPLDFGSTYTLLGQIISLVFIQLGGVGYMALSSFIILKQFSRLPSLSAGLLRVEFQLPERYPLISFVYSVFVLTLVIESIGTLVLYQGFRDAGIPQPIWAAIFHSVSAFCTAGFSIYPESLAGYLDQPLITNTILVLSLLGSIGFIVLLDIGQMIIRKRRWISLTSRIILVSTVVLVILSTFLLFCSESSRAMAEEHGWNKIVFQAIAAHTTVGFSNHDINAFSRSGIFVFILLMIIGASPAGTGGGIKTTSITALFGVLKSILQRRQRVTLFKKEISASNIYLAVSSAVFYVFVLLLGIWALLLVEGTHIPFKQLLFEATSALSTVGLSMGATEALSDAGKLIISAMMFIGRLGVLTFGFALISKAPRLRHPPEIEDIAI